MQLTQNNDGDDLLKRMVEKQTDQEELSPMDPPDAYAPPALEVIPYEEMHPFLQGLRDEHEVFVEKLDAFEKALLRIQESGLEKGVEGRLREFYWFFDNEIIKHSQNEDKTLFPLLHQRLIEKGEHSQGPDTTTVVNVLEDDHLEAVQLAAISLISSGSPCAYPILNPRWSLWMRH